MLADYKITHHNSLYGYLICRLFLLSSVFVCAQSHEKPWLLSFGVGKSHLVNTPGFQSSFYMPTLSMYRYAGDGFSFGFGITSNTFFQDHRTYIGTELNMRYSLSKVISTGDRWDPYLEIGVGQAILSNNSTLHIVGSFGLQYWISENVGIQIHNSYKSDFLRRGLGLYQVSFSIGWRFGGRDRDRDGTYDKIDVCPDDPGAAYFSGCPDSDKDGIQDIKDDCPQQAGLLEFSGCPDTDKDNIPDKKDKCPTTAGNKKTQGCPDRDKDLIRDADDRCPETAGVIENKGCPPPDRDGDHIPDHRDKCPDQQGDIANDGCPENLPENIKQQLLNYAKTILFKTGTADIKGTSQDIIIAIYEILKDFPRVEFRIEGHTDNTGSSAHNQYISEQRAKRVRQELIALGIPSENLTAVGFGEMRPLATNDTPNGRRQNRRVEINLVR